MFLALKEIRRAKVRFGLLAGAVGLLVFLILFQQALLTGLITQFIGALRNQSAPVLVYGEQARRNLEGSVVTPQQATAIAAVPGVGATGPLGQGTFTVTADGELKDAVIFGYELGGLGAPTTMSDGRLPEGPGEAVASSRSSGEGFGLGDVVRVEPGGGEITIVGLANDINYSVTPTLFTSFDTYADARRARNPDARDIFPSALLVAPADGTSPSEVTAAINDQVPEVEALTRQQAVDGSPGVSQVRSSFFIVIGLFYVVVPLVTGLFFLILTFQKARSLTLLRAIGAKASTLVSALLIQVTLVVVVGVLVATALFALATLGANTLGLSVEVAPIVVTGVVVLLFALLAAFVAIRRVLRIDPLQATTGAEVRA